ncbi:MAG: hypothetical protein AAF849_01500 [Bacteroidota bacterium]
MKKLFLSFFAMIAFVAMSFAQDVIVDDPVDGDPSITLSAGESGAGDDLFVQATTGNQRTRLLVIPSGTDTRAFIQVGNSSSQTDLGFARLGARNDYAILSTGNTGSPAQSLNKVGIELDGGNIDPSDTEAFVIARNGFISTGAPEVLLKVDGAGVETIEAKVLATVAAPDYVFADDYNLRSLEEVEAYINENSHLPEIPSAAEFEADGIQLGKMSFDLLKKVEELTLYMIDMKKENEALKARVAELENR